jgi:hypothetical protein
MIIRKPVESRSSGAISIHLSLSAVFVLLLSLFVAGGFAAHEWFSLSTRARAASSSGPAAEPDLIAPPGPQTTGPWGELLVRDIELEQPEEYALYSNAPSAEIWTFEGRDQDQVRALMLSCGVASDRVARALPSARTPAASSNTVLEADDDLVFSLPPECRAQLYAELGRSPENQFMQFPICFRGNSFDTWFDDGKVSGGTVALLKQLLYKRGETLCFSDMDALMSRLPSDEERTRATRALSHQSAVLVALRIRPDADLDKLLEYWNSAPGVRLIDTRPLLESLKRLPSGGIASILYFLPQFARQRLYTYPLPAQPGDPTIDCHWSTMNFFNETPDNRFANPAYTTAFLKDHYYEVAKPTAYGDIIMLVNNHNIAIHSAVYLAGDIVFTKNGNNFRQPWMLMRLKDLLAAYETSDPPRVMVFRSRDR